MNFRAAKLCLSLELSGGTVQTIVIDEHLMNGERTVPIKLYSNFFLFDESSAIMELEMESKDL